MFDLNIQKRSITNLILVITTFLVLSFIMVLVTQWITPSFFFIDDAQDALLPAFRDIGRIYVNGELPILSSRAMWGGNYLVDMVYSPLNPIVILTGVITYLTGSAQPAVSIMATLILFSGMCGAYALARNFSISSYNSFLCAILVVTTPINYFISLQSWWNSAIAFSHFLLAAAGTLYFISKTSYFRFLLASILVILLFTIAFSQAHLAYGIFVIIASFDKVFKKKNIYTILSCFFPLIIGLLIAWIPLTLESIVESSNLLRRSTLSNSGNFMKVGFDQILFCFNPFYYTYLHWFGGYRQMPLSICYAGLIALWPIVMCNYTISFLKKHFICIVFFATMSMLLLGPSNIGPLRFPIRLAPYVVLPVILITCSIISDKSWTTSKIKNYVLIGVVAFSSYFQWANGESSLLSGDHLRALLLFLIYISGTLFIFYFIKSEKIQSIALMLICFFVFIATIFCVRSLSPKFFHERVMGDNFNGFRKSNYYHLWMARDGEMASEFNLGHAQPLLFDYKTVNGYSPVGHKGFSSLFSFHVNGDTTHFNLNGVETLKLLYKPIGANVDKILAQALNIQYIYMYANDFDKVAPEICSPLLFNEIDNKRVRIEIQPLPDKQGSISIQEPVISASLISKRGENCEDYKIRSSPHERTIIFSRPYWRGYRATLNGTDIPTDQFRGALLSIKLKPYDSGVLSINYIPSTLIFSFISITLGILFSIMIYPLLNKEYKCI